jgi:hypothetical protein
VVVAAAILVAVPVCTGCSERGRGSAGGLVGDPQVVCTLIERLDATGKDVAAADVRDPATFDAALDSAVKQYSTVLADLEKVAPSSLRADVQRLQAAVEQYRFADGVEPHAALDTYRTSNCT